MQSSALYTYCPFTYISNIDLPWELEVEPSLKSCSPPVDCEIESREEVLTQKTIFDEISSYEVNCKDAIPQPSRVPGIRPKTIKDRRERNKVSSAIFRERRRKELEDLENQAFVLTQQVKSINIQIEASIDIFFSEHNFIFRQDTEDHLKKNAQQQLMITIHQLFSKLIEQNAFSFPAVSRNRKKSKIHETVINDFKNNKLLCKEVRNSLSNSIKKYRKIVPNTTIKPLSAAKDQHMETLILEISQVFNTLYEECRYAFTR